MEHDRRKRWSVERGIEIISKLRRLSDGLKARHSDIPWPKVAGIGNVLRHEYEDVSPPVLWKVAREDLPVPEVCRVSPRRHRPAKGVAKTRRGR